MNHLNSKNAARLFGIAFLWSGALGFIPNPLVSLTGVFDVKFMLIPVHVLTARVFFVGAARSEAVTRRTLQAVAVVYVSLAILGFIIKGTLLPGLVHINQAEQWLCVGLAIVILAAGFGSPKLRGSDPVSA